MCACVCVYVCVCVCVCACLFKPNFLKDDISWIFPVSFLWAHACHGKLPDMVVSFMTFLTFPCEKQ